MTIDDTASSDLFADDSILDADPVDDDGQPLEVFHDREYRVRAYRKADDRVLIRGAVRDQKPPGLYLEDDPDPLTVHHMRVDIEVAYPSMEIVAANVEFVTHPNETCPGIVGHYDKLVGLSIARGFTHKVRDLFGGPRACTHTTMLLQAMAPVAIQCLWSMRMSMVHRAAATGADVPEPPTDMWRTNLNSCHVWAEDSETVARLEAGETLDPPVFVRERMVSLGLTPDDWKSRLGS